jgi:lipopolysaccharide export system protein LptA
MLRRLLRVSLFWIILGAAWAATELPVGQGTLNADAGEFDMRDRFYHFWSNVQFRYPGMLDLDCEDLRIRLMPDGSKVDRLVASNRVVMTIVQLPSTNALSTHAGAGMTNLVHAAVAEYSGTNDVVVLSGSPEFGQPWVEGVEGSFKADVITFDRANDRIAAKGHFQMIVKPGSLPKGALTDPRTNAAPARPSN